MLLIIRSASVLSNDAPTTEIYTLSLHDALPIYRRVFGVIPGRSRPQPPDPHARQPDDRRHPVAIRQQFREGDRKSTRLNSSHMSISYAVFCLKKKNIENEAVGRIINSRGRTIYW